MLSNILPNRFSHSLDFLNVDKLSEIRLRVNSHTVINYGGRFYLGENGLANDKKDALIINGKELSDIIFKACECSIYAHNEELKQGYITLNNGVRIGICGEVVLDKDTVKTIKNFSSINIRIPHLVKNCSLNVLPYLHNEFGAMNTLIIAPPGAGKTTFLRDFATLLSDKFIAKNILIVDERNEICANLNGKPTLYIGEFVDVYSGCSKSFGITNGIRTMSPDVIFLDEIVNEQDVLALKSVVGAGVKFVATTHSKDLEDLHSKFAFREVLKEKIFDRFVVLSERKGAGTIEGVWDSQENCLYCGS